MTPEHNTYMTLRQHLHNTCMTPRMTLGWHLDQHLHCTCSVVRNTVSSVNCQNQLLQNLFDRISQIGSAKNNFDFDTRLVTLSHLKHYSCLTCSAKWAKLVRHNHIFCFANTWPITLQIPKHSLLPNMFGAIFKHNYLYLYILEAVEAEQKKFKVKKMKMWNHQLSFTSWYRFCKWFGLTTTCLSIREK